MYVGKDTNAFPTFFGGDFINNEYKNLYDSIVLIVQNILSERGVTKYLTGKVISKAGNTYGVLIGDDEVALKARSGNTFNVNDVVYICLPNGDLSTAFIDTIRP